MQNYYIEKMRAVLLQLQAQCKQYRAKMKENDSIYSPTVAEKENEKCSYQMKIDTQTAIDQLTAQMTEAAKRLNMWNAPKASDLTEDAALFQSGVPMSAQEIQQFRQLYRSNGTMLRVIDGYCTAQGINDSFTQKPATAQEKFDTYSKVYRSAVNMVNQIYAAPERVNLSSWCDTESPFSENLYNTLGSGQELRTDEKLRYEFSDPFQPIVTPSHNELSGEYFFS